MAPKNHLTVVFFCAIALMASTSAMTCDEFAADTGHAFEGLHVRTIESSHTYCDNMSVSQSYSFSNSHVTGVNIMFDAQSNIENHWDNLVISFVDANGVTQSSTYTGTTFADLTVTASSFSLTFTSDNSNHNWGYSFTATPVHERNCSDFRSYAGATYDSLVPQTIISSHPYCDNLVVSQSYSFSDSSVASLDIVFDSRSHIENLWDKLAISYVDNSGTSQSTTFTGSSLANLTVNASSFTLAFTSDASVTYWGYSFTVSPVQGTNCSDFSNNTGDTFDSMDAQTIASSHPYCDNLSVSQTYTFSNMAVSSIDLVFDTQSNIESYWDSLVISYISGGFPQTATYSGTAFANLTIPDSTFTLTFTSDSSNTYWGYSFTATPVQEYTCDDFTSQPSQTFEGTGIQNIASSHPYCNNMSVTQSYTFSDPTVYQLEIGFGSQSSIESGYDNLVLSYTDASTGSVVSTNFTGDTFSYLTITSNSFDLTFTSDGSVTNWGYIFGITPMITTTTKDVVVKKEKRSPEELAQIINTFMTWKERNQ